MLDGLLEIEEDVDRFFAYAPPRRRTGMLGETRTAWDEPSHCLREWVTRRGGCLSRRATRDHAWHHVAVIPGAQLNRRITHAVRAEPADAIHAVSRFLPLAAPRELRLRPAAWRRRAIIPFESMRAIRRRHQPDLHPRGLTRRHIPPVVPVALAALVTLVTRIMSVVVAMDGILLSVTPTAMVPADHPAARESQCARDQKTHRHEISRFHRHAPN